jgi:hypothetical protein
MFQLTNEQRRCFGITPVEADWELRQLPRSRDDYYYDTCAIRSLLRSARRFSSNSALTKKILLKRIFKNENGKRKNYRFRADTPWCCS